MTVGPRRFARSVAIGAACLAALVGTVVASGLRQPAATRQGPASVDITWMSISNLYYELGDLKVITDGYITRLPQAAFSGGGGGLAKTSRPFEPDVDSIKKVLVAIGGRSSVNLLLTGHSHFDHSFDTATWSKNTGARIIGSTTTCLQTRAQEVPAARCQAVFGGEAIALRPGVTMYVVRWNHSGDPAVNPEQHNPVELTAVPKLDPVSGGLRAGVAEDFPNGGGNRAFLFVVDGPDRRYSWFFQNSASAVDLEVPIVVDGKNYGAPLDNLRAAMKAAGLTSVDLWIGSAGRPVAALVLPVLEPKFFLPVHWDGLWSPFWSGVPQPYADAPLETLLTESKVQLVRPGQYMDKWRLDASGIHPVPNETIKSRLGFK